MFLYQDLYALRLFTSWWQDRIYMYVFIHEFYVRPLLIGIYINLNCNEWISLIAHWKCNTVRIYTQKIYVYKYDWYSGGMRELLQCTSGCLPVVQWSDSLLPRNLMANCQYLCFHHHWTSTRMISPLTSRC